ncbi:MAG TPA: hypothetical protein VK802_17040 [Streptosporangiaceae bacterium]|nr:hypothetical protein [Streptosporangiaceae bacterium]
MGDLYALVSAGGSPGVTTAAMALALAWPSSAIVAECDPSGGDILAGLLTGHVPASLGLMEHAIEAGRDGYAAARALGDQLIPLDADGTRKLLPGLTDPRQAAGLASAWPAVAATLAVQHADVIADCGRLDAGPGQPNAILTTARTVALVMRPTIRQVWSALSRVEILTQLGVSSRLALLLTGPGTHSAREVAQALGIPVAAALPDDARSAAMLSDGVGGERSLSSGSLLRSARAAGQALRGHVTDATRQSARKGALR